MKTFKSYLSEARRNANLPAQAKLNALQQLERWKDSPDIHISYTAINKIGINPKSKFADTPLGVYAYPLKEIWNDIQSEGVRNVRFAANTSKFIFVLKERGQALLDVSRYTKAMLDADLLKIRKMVGNETFEAAEKTVLIHLKKDKPYKYLQYLLYVISSSTRKKNAAGISANITKMLLDLGYTGFSDRTGMGQIHSAEEIQSFFLTPRAYDVVASIEINDVDIKDQPIRDLADYLKKNAAKLNDDEIIEIVLKDLTLAKYMGPPRTEVLKVLISKKQAEKWKSKQHKNDDSDLDSKDYIPAESVISGTYLLFNYSKLPEDLLSWILKTGGETNNYEMSSAVIHWMKTKNYKPSNKFVLDNIKYTPRLIEIMTSVSKDIAKDVIKNHGYQYTIGDLSKKISEKDMLDVLGTINNFDVSSISSYYPVVAKFLYNQLLKNKNPTDDDIARAAIYIQKGHRDPPMDIINGLKAKFPDFDFMWVGRWDFWKR